MEKTDEAPKPRSNTRFVWLFIHRGILLMHPVVLASAKLTHDVTGTLYLPATAVVAHRPLAEFR